MIITRSKRLLHCRAMMAGMTSSEAIKIAPISFSPVAITLRVISTVIPEMIPEGRPMTAAYSQSKIETFISL